MGLLKAELYKLFCDKQIKFVILIIVLYLVYSFFGLEKPIDTSFEGWLISNTTDSVFMLFFIGIVAATVFTIDYSNKTYKNFFPYIDKHESFIAKVEANLIGSFVLLGIWYLTVVLLAIVVTKTFQVNVLKNLISRFVVQYLLMVFHSSSILMIGVITRSRIIASSFTVISWVLYTFIPVGEGVFFDVVVSGYRWGTDGILWLNILFVVVYIFACIMGEIIFKWQEVRI